MPTGAPRSGRCGSCSSRTDASSSTCSRPAPDDIEETQGRWIEREQGIFERADWNEQERTLVLHVRGHDAEVALSLSWLSVAEWRILLSEEGFAVDGLYGWFDRTPWQGHEDSIWICSRRD